MSAETHTHPFGPIKGIRLVTTHCLNRYRERAGVTGTAGEVLRKLEKWLEEARPAILKPGTVAGKMFRHGCRAATYFLMGNPRKGKGWVLVAEGSVLRTVHVNDSGEWTLLEHRK